MRISSAPPREARTRRRSAHELVGGYPWISGAIGLVIVSTLIVLWARTRPGYDPYGWLVWGHLTLHWALNTNGAPSWKPLPYLFTVPYALFGHYSMWLWMITAVAVTLAGVVFAWRIAFTLTAASPERRYASYAAGLVASVALLGMGSGALNTYTHVTLSAQSDTMIVALALGAIDCHLNGRLRWAFWLGVLASLGRPEAWPFFGLYAIWLFFKRPELRRHVIAGVVLLPLLWFGIPGLTSKSPFTAGNLAQNSPRALKSNKFFGALHRFLALEPVPVEIAVLLLVALSVVRLALSRRGARLTGLARDKATLLLAAGAALWALIEGAFALHGWPANARYTFEPAGIVAVLAGVFVGRVILDVPPLVSRLALRASPSRIRPRLATSLGAWGAIVVLLVLGASVAPTAASRLRTERRDLTHERARTQELGRLKVVVDKLGASRILACGQPNIPIGYQSTMAFYMGTDVGRLYVIPSVIKVRPHTLVNFYPLSNGWKVFPTHVTAASAPRCQGLRLTYRS